MNKTFLFTNTGRILESDHEFIEAAFEDWKKGMYEIDDINARVELLGDVIDELQQGGFPLSSDTRWESLESAVWTIATKLWIIQWRATYQPVTPK